MAAKVVEAHEAIQAIRSGATLAICGTGSVLEPDLLLDALEARFMASGDPHDLTIVSPMVPGDQPGSGGLNHVAHAGMLRRFIGSAFSTTRHPKLIDLITSGEVEGYTVGMGTLVQLLWEIGRGGPGLLTKIGLGTFLDPRQGGGAMNESSARPPVSLERFADEEYLFYPSIPIDFVFIRGTSADEDGYIAMEEEPNQLAVRELALAAKASGGIVVAQVKRLVEAGSLDAREVALPGPLVDFVVVHPKQTQVSPAMQDPALGWNPALVGAVSVPLDSVPAIDDGLTRVILRRAALELHRGDVVNLGAGVPTRLPQIALEEGFLNEVTFTNEHGIYGGVMASVFGKSFVPAYNPRARMDSGFQFAYYTATGVDIAFLGMGQVDRHGNVNVSHFGPVLSGPGGFNNIVEGADRIVICGSFTAGGLKVETSDGGLKIIKEGRHNKFVNEVQQITMNASASLAQGKEVIYVTERAVFCLERDGIMLTEVAPGIDVESDVLSRLPFTVDADSALREMDSCVFGSGRLQLSEGRA